MTKNTASVVVCLFVCLSVCQFDSPSFCLSVSSSFCQSVLTSICPSVCPYFHLSISLSIRQSFCLSVSPYFLLSVHQSVPFFCPSIHPFIHLPINPSVFLPVCLSVCNPVCLTVCLSVCLLTHLLCLFHLLPVCSSFHLSISQSDPLPAYMLAYLSACLFLSERLFDCQTVKTAKTTKLCINLSNMFICLSICLFVLTNSSKFLAVYYFVVSFLYVLPP
jgi:hypothetical protein